MSDLQPILVMLDIRPVREGDVSVEEIDLRNKELSAEDDRDVQIFVGNKVDVPVEENHPVPVSGIETLVSDITSEPMTDKDVMEVLMNTNHDPMWELKSAGAKVYRLDGRSKKIVKKEPKIKYHGLELGKPELQDDFYENVLAIIREPVSPKKAVNASTYYNVRPAVVPAKVNYDLPEPILASAPVFKPLPVVSRKDDRIREEKVVDFYRPEVKRELRPVRTAVIDLKPRPLNFHTPSKKRRTGLWFLAVLAVGAFAYGITLKNEVLSGGTTAFNNLEKAEANLKNFNFSGAARNFDESYRDFSQIGQTMNLMSAGLSGIFSNLPGAGKLRSAGDAVEAGKLIAQSGKAMSEAISYLAKTGSILDPSATLADGATSNKIQPAEIIRKIKDALELSNKNFEQAKTLLADIDTSVIPADQQKKLEDFKSKLPLLEEYLGQAKNFADFFQGIVGIDQNKKYLLLFENSSELRPTGGFPGTYGVVSFTGGGLSDFHVDDVYNLDGQLTENIIPPKQLQHITPTWGMRDAAWFIDFPASARKVMSFFSTEAGYNVDGIITLNPAIVSKILDIVGPIDMPQYNMKLTGDNFLANLQEEVEYGKNRTQPKTVVVDFAPLFLHKLYSASSEQWMKIFSVMMDGLAQKDILLYFNDRDLEKFATSQGFAGEVKDPGSDYLTVNFSNIRGSKTDAVTDATAVIDSKFENGQVVHHLTLTRNHRGGDKQHGFYNRENSTYVRVLVPDDAQILNVSGYDTPNYRPLTNYGLVGNFEKDADLTKLESSFYESPFRGVDMFQESGKKGIGFWMLTQAGTAKTVELEYSTPLDNQSGFYGFYFQKQPGVTWKDVNFNLTLPENLNVIDSSSNLNHVGNLYTFEDVVNKDVEFKVKFK